jgi:hypothetical protein
MKVVLASIVVLVAACATAKYPSTGGGGDDTAQLPDSGLRRFDSGPQQPDSGVQQQPDSGVQQQPDSGVQQQPDSGVIGGCTPPAAGGTCDTSPQCGCPGQACSVTDFTTGATSCVAAGTTPDFGNCTGNGVGQCRAGSTCVDGVCSPYCGSLSDCPGANRDCFQVSGSTGAAVPGFKVCTQFCDPVSPTLNSGTYQPCGAGVHCFPDTTGVSSCYGPAATSGGQQAAYCDDVSGSGGDPTLCAPGYACVGSTFFDCKKFCHVGSNANCTGSAAGLTCTPFSTKQYAGSVELGFCN